MDFPGNVPSFERLWFLLMKEDVGYEEFLAAVYEAETEGSEGKVVNFKAKALTVEKIVKNRESNKLKRFEATN